MTKTEFVAVFVRLAGLILLLTGAGMFPYLIAVLWDSRALSVPEQWGLALALLSQIAWILAALGLAVFPHIVAAWFVGAQAGQPLVFDWSKGTIEAVAFSTVGLFFFASGLRDLGLALFHPIVLSLVSSDAPPFAALSLSTLIGPAMSLMIGVWLLLGARGLARVLTWARGRDAAPGQDAS